MNEKELELLDYLAMLRRHKWILIAVFIVVTGIGALRTFRQIPMYRATATILIERETPRVLETADIVPLGAMYAYQDYYNTQIKILESRDIREKAIERLGGPEVELGGMMIEPIERSWLAKLHIVHRDPAKAALAANTVAEVFVEENLNRKMRTLGEAQHWLIEQMHEAERELTQAEEALEDYRRRTGEISLDQAQDITLTRLNQLNVAYTQAQDARISAEAQYRNFQNMSIEDLDFLPDVVENQLIQSLRRDVIEKQNQYRKMLEMYTPSHPDMVRLSTQISDIEEKIEAERESEISKLTSQKLIEIANLTDQYRRNYESAFKRETDLKAELDQQQEAALSLSSTAVTYNILKRTADTKRELYQMLLRQAQATGVTTELRANNISILDRAQEPRSPISPNTSRNIIMSMLLGLLMGGGLVFFTEYMHNTVNTPEDISDTLPGTSVKLLGSVPHVKATENGEPLEVLTRGKAHSQAVNSFGLLRTNILFPPPKKPLQNILVTSSIRGEGKTFVSSNLAIAFAHIGLNCLIVDTDLRKPRMHKIFGLHDKKGLAEYLAGEATIEEVIHHLPDKNLSLLPCGKTPHEPELLISSEKMKELGRLLKERFDYIIYDSPPVAPVADAILLSASIADRTILIAKAERTPRRIFKQTYQMLEEAREGIVSGVVLNEISHESSYHYYRYYKYYRDYHTETTPKS